MKHVLAFAWLLALLASAYGQNTAPSDADPKTAESGKTDPANPTFAEPVEVTNGGEAFRNLIYPTPVLQDMNGDGTPELVVGDLRGHVWICRKPSADGETTLSDVEWTRLEHAQAAGKALKLQNW